MDLMETYEMQLSEIEVLQSIYPNENEVEIEDLVVFSDMKHYVHSEGKSQEPAKMMTLTINIACEEPNCSVQLRAIMPKDYPVCAFPDIFLRCDKLSREMQLKLNKAANVYKESLGMGETCLYQVAQWASENVGKCIVPLTNQSVSSELLVEEIPDAVVYTRMWIYSHHIYNKEKRKCILEWAKELDLSGFSMPGKPGVVCVEGIQHHCEEYWQRLRRQTWKRLTVAHREEQLGDIRLQEFRKFKCPLTEIDFGVHGGRDYHMDLGKFFEFLTVHQSKEIFQILFGVQGTVADKT